MVQNEFIKEHLDLANEYEVQEKYKEELAELNVIKKEYNDEMINNKYNYISSLASKEPKDKQVIYSGKDGDLYWSIDDQGLLLVAGNGDYDDVPRWIKHRNDIITAIVDVTDITSCFAMFYNCTSLVSVDLSHFDTSKSNSMRYMFSDCWDLSEVDLSHLDTSNVTDMSGMFASCNFGALDLSSFNTSHVTDMSEMFYECHNLAYLDLSNFDTIEVTDMSNMFDGCYMLSLLNIKNFIAAKVKSTRFMFYECHSLTSLNMEHFNIDKVANTENMFKGCTRLKRN